MATVSNLNAESLLTLIVIRDPISWVLKLLSNHFTVGAAA